MSPRALLLVLCLALPVQPAVAQGFMDFLFDWDSPSSRRPSGYVRPHAPPSVSRYDAPWPFGSPFSPLPYDALSASDSTAYRTLCVRMCDGFYFPISYATSSANFTRDAETCAAACGPDARLFYHPTHSGDIDAMLDLTGRAYASYPTAFKYRKALVQGCQCRPQPWTDAERARHRAYATMQTPLANQSAAPNAMPVSSQTLGAPSISVVRDNAQTVARPDPVQRQTEIEQRGWFRGDKPDRAGRSRYGWPGMR
jgi:Protein of unknown function (DUF2865)